jgi:hypothetical protein
VNHGRYHGIRPEGRPIELRVRIERMQGRGVLVGLLDGHDREKFWLPAQYPAEWPAAPEAGETVTVRVPRWLAHKHQPVVALRSGFQRSLNFYTPPPLSADASKPGSFPMTEYPRDAGKGSLWKNDKREREAHPLYKGSAEIGGKKYWVSAWLRKSERTGETFMSLAFREAEARPTEQPPNSYAQATGRDDRAQQQPERDWRETEIPF